MFKQPYLASILSGNKASYQNQGWFENSSNIFVLLLVVKQQLEVTHTGCHCNWVFGSGKTLWEETVDLINTSAVEALWKQQEKRVKERV